MNKTLRVVGHLCIVLMLGFVIGCSDDDSTPTEPDPPVTPNPSGTIGVYADAAGTNPNIVDTGGNVPVYIIHKTDGATAAQFRVEAPAGWTLLASQSQFPVTLYPPFGGDLTDGVSIGYGSCVSGNIHVLTVTYDSPGNTPAGAMFKVLPHSDTPEAIQVVDCSQNLLEDGVGEETVVTVP